MGFLLSGLAPAMTRIGFFFYKMIIEAKALKKLQIQRRKRREEK